LPMARRNSWVCRRPLTFILLAALFLGAAGSVAGEDLLKGVTLLPHWSPQAQFAGYFMAHHKGFYRKHGLDVSILTGGPNRPSLELLKKGECDFATAWLSAAIQESSRGVKLINVGQIVQKSALMIVAKKAGGITKPEHLEGKRVGLWGGDFRIQPMAFFRKYNLNVKVVPQYYSVNLFLRGGVDAASAMWYNEYHTILNAGLNPDELTTFFFHKHGLNFPEDGIYVLEETFKKDPATSCAFVLGSVEGWLYAATHPDEALDVVLNYMSKAGVPANRIHQKWMLEHMKELIMPEDEERVMGRLLQSDFSRVAEELKRGGLIRQIPDFTSFSKECIGSVEK
jgi:NitT/TauT family transport system substrate-binding protein